MIKDEIKEYIVKINGGSGVIYQPKHKDYTYILTVKHIFDNISNYENKVNIYKHISGKKDCDLLTTLKLSEGDNYFPHTNKDIAILKIRKLSITKNLPLINLPENPDNYNWVLAGFPNKRNDKKFCKDKIRLDDNLRILDDKSDGKREGQISSNPNLEELKGQSGGGIFYIGNNSFKLLGVQNAIPIEDEYLGRIEFSEVYNFNEIINNLDGELEVIKIKNITLLNENTKYIDALIDHSNIKLNDSNYYINYNKQKIEIDYLKEDNILNDSNIIIFGEGGIGKTSLIKKIYENYTLPIFIFKASELHVKNINELFSSYGDFNLNKFKDFYKNLKNKYIVIDSAEKLSEINHDPFKELVNYLKNDGWKFIFTTRVEYLENLEYLLNSLEVNYVKQEIKNISIKKLEEISKKYNFILPKSEKLKELLVIPFYLNEYLQLKSIKRDSFDIKDFRKHLWDKKIKNDMDTSNSIHIKREEVFIQLSFERANEFFIKIHDKYNQDAIEGLIKDGIIRTDKDDINYLIGHDIYEEWALVKYIEKSYSENLDSFFEKLGDSLAIKKIFRVWLRDYPKKAEYIFEKIFLENNISQEWKDEVIISLFDIDNFYDFLENFQLEILENDNKVLKKIINLIKTACKEPDYRWMKAFESYNSFFYIPKGNSWKDIIKFILEYKDDINFETIPDILEVSKDWVKKNDKGETTKSIGLISLYFIENCKNTQYKTELSKIILKSSLEIKKELSVIFDYMLLKSQNEIINSNYAELVNFTINNLLDSSNITKALPNYVINFMKKMWVKEKEKDSDLYGYRVQELNKSKEEIFGLVNKFHTNSSPASAFQTSIFSLLRNYPKQTIDFIINFTNNSTNKYVESMSDKKYDNIFKVKFSIDNVYVEQYMSSILWYMYRQGGPDLLSSIHMALEKYLLELGKDASSSELEDICKNILLKTNSASISSIISSIDLAYPDKLFNTAIIMLQVKEFIIYDYERWAKDSLGYGKLLYSIGNNFKKKFFQDERIKTYDDEFRKKSLMKVIFQYQMLQKGDAKDSYMIKNREIWDIFDIHFKKLNKSKELQWHKYLLYMDIRKQQLKYIETENGGKIEGRPSLPKEIEEENKRIEIESNDFNSYTSLGAWALNSLNDKPYKSIYNENPRLAFDNFIELYNSKDNINTPLTGLLELPGIIIPVFIKSHYSLLSKSEKEFCFNFIISKNHSFLQEEASLNSYFSNNIINILPKLLEIYSEKEKRIEIKRKIINTLISYKNPETKISLFHIKGPDYVKSYELINDDLWKIDSNFARIMFYGIINIMTNMKKAIDSFYKEKKSESEKTRIEMESIYGKGERIHKNNRYLNNTKEFKDFLSKFYKQEETNKIISSIVESNFNNYNIDFTKIESLDDLIIIFYLLPKKLNEFEDFEIILSLLENIFKRLSNENKDVSPELIMEFERLLAYRILTLNNNGKVKEILTVLFKYINKIAYNNYIDYIFWAQTEIKIDKNFWYIWNQIYSIYIKNKDFDSKNDTNNRFLLSYFFADEFKSNLKQLEFIKLSNKKTFKRVIEALNNNEVIFYSLCKNLNTIFSIFEDDGIFWLENMIKNNIIFKNKGLEKNTVFYLEKFIVFYTKRNSNKIKEEVKVKKGIITILNFLVNNGSCVAYLIRENI